MVFFEVEIPVPLKNVVLKRSRIYAIKRRAHQCIVLPMNAFGGK
jgi:hypothetical protein